MKTSNHTTKQRLLIAKANKEAKQKELDKQNKYILIFGAVAVATILLTAII